MIHIKSSDQNVLVSWYGAYTRTQNLAKPTIDDESENECSTLLCARKLGIDLCLRASWVQHFSGLSVCSGWAPGWKQSDRPTLVSFDSHTPANGKTDWFPCTLHLVERGESPKSRWMPEPYSETHFWVHPGVGRDSAQLFIPAKTVGASMEGIGPTADICVGL